MKLRKLMSFNHKKKVKNPEVLKEEVTFVTVEEKLLILMND